MMYSSQVWQEDGHSFGAEVTICKFMELYVRAKDVKVKTAEARDAAFLSAYLPEAHEIELLIEVLDAAQAADLNLCCSNSASGQRILSEFSAARRKQQLKNAAEPLMQ